MFGNWNLLGSFTLGSKIMAILWWPHLAAELVDIVLREAGGGGVVQHDRLLVPGRVVAYSEEIFRL